jgi:hypothetical protein
MVSFAGLFEVTAIGNYQHIIDTIPFKVNFHSDFVLLVLFVYVVYKLFFKKREIVELPMQKQVEPLKKQDLTVEQLKQYNGVDDEHICMAICGKVIDEMRSGEVIWGICNAMDFPRFMMLRGEKISMDPMAPMEVLTFDQNF